MHVSISLLMVVVVVGLAWLPHRQAQTMHTLAKCSRCTDLNGFELFSS